MEDLRIKETKGGRCMKANEAPEKLYVDLFKGEWNVSKSPVVTSVEYTRTDAFIEKAVKWLDDNAVKYWGTDAVDNGMMIYDFKNAMKL